MSNPVVLVDMDGVLSDFDGWLYERSSLWPSLNPDRSAQRHYFLTDEVMPADAKRMREVVNSSRIFAELDPLPGAIAGLWALAEEADVWICTKPLDANPHCRDDKAAWLRRHFGPEFGAKCIIAPDKSMVRGAVLLDDCPKREQWRRADWTPIVFEQPFNRKDPEYLGLPRYSWDQPLENILQYT